MKINTFFAVVFVFTAFTQSMGVSAMARQVFRRHAAKAGQALFRDQHVGHIISQGNGGANHPLNFFKQGGKVNQMLRKSGDALNCLMAGKKQCKQAIQVSGIDLDASKLFKTGKQAVKGFDKDKMNALACAFMGQTACQQAGLGGESDVDVLFNLGIAAVREAMQFI